MRPGMKNIGELTEELERAKGELSAAQEVYSDAYTEWKTALEDMGELSVGDFVSVFCRGFSNFTAETFGHFGVCGEAGMRLHDQGLARKRGKRHDPRSNEPCSCGLRGCPMDAKPEQKAEDRRDVEAPKEGPFEVGRIRDEADPWDAFLPEGWKWYKLNGAMCLKHSVMRIWPDRPGETAKETVGEAESARLHAIVRARNGDWDAVLPEGSEWRFWSKDAGWYMEDSRANSWAIWKDRAGDKALLKFGESVAERLRKLVALRNEVDPPDRQVSKVTAVNTCTMHSDDNPKGDSPWSITGMKSSKTHLPHSYVHIGHDAIPSHEPDVRSEWKTVDPNPPGAGE